LVNRHFDGTAKRDLERDIYMIASIDLKENRIGYE